MRLRLVGLMVLVVVGGATMDGSGESWLIYFVGSAIQIAGFVLLFLMSYRDGFRAGVASVPLGGMGLASGDDRAHDGQHVWNVELGAFERQPKERLQ